MSLPRLFTVRHGATEWSLSRKQTGRTDIALSQLGIDQVKAVGQTSVGGNGVVMPPTLSKVYDPVNYSSEYSLNYIVSVPP